MLAFRSEGDVHAWLERTGHPFGAMTDFATMWALVRQWYAGRMERSWRGRSATDAQAIIDGLGLEGDFWRIAQRKAT